MQLQPRMVNLNRIIMSAGDPKKYRLTATSTEAAVTVTGEVKQCSHRVRGACPRLPDPGLSVGEEGAGSRACTCLTELQRIRVRVPKKTVEAEELKALPCRAHPIFVWTVPFCISPPGLRF